MRRPFILPWLALLACSPSIKPDASSGTPPGNDPTPDAALWGDDAGDTQDGDDAANPWDTGAATLPEDAAAPIPVGSDASPAPVDAGSEGACTQPLGAGDLLVDELMIESVAGAGDDGEWLEVSSTAGCAVNLRGLHGECPVGSKVYTFDVSEDVWVPPGGTFIVADSEDPAVNHYLPGFVLAWAGQPGDVLRNEGGTVTLSVGEVLVVSLTWPSMKLIIGTTVELPADCPTGDADQFGVWQSATASWFPGFYGTPNAANTDVQCP